MRRGGCSASRRGGVLGPVPGYEQSPWAAASRQRDLLGGARVRAWREARGSGPGSQSGRRPGTDRPPPEPAPQSRPAAPRAAAARHGYEVRKTLDQQGTYLPGRGPQGAATARCFPRAAGHASRRAWTRTLLPCVGGAVSRQRLLQGGSPRASLLPVGGAAAALSFRWAGLWTPLLPVGGTAKARGSRGAGPGICSRASGGAFPTVLRCFSWRPA